MMMMNLIQTILLVGQTERVISNIELFGFQLMLFLLHRHYNLTN